MTFSEKEKKIMIEIAVSEADGLVPVIVGAGCNCTWMSVERAEMAKDLGADGVLAIVPYYNRPPYRGIVKHFESIAKVGLPVIVYHHPKRTGVALSVEELVGISQIEGVVGIKEASGDIEFAKKLIGAVDVPIFCGDDALTLEMIKLGAKGTISVVSNIIPNEWKEMVTLALGGDWEKASEIDKRYRPLVDAIGLEVNPIGVKYALSVLGVCEPHMRLPLCEPLEETKRAIEKSLGCIKSVV